VIGAGGNASNQSAMLVVRGLATGEVARHNIFRLVVREMTLALFIGSTMMAVAYLRVYLFHSDDGNSAALAVGCRLLTPAGLLSLVTFFLNTTYDC
jgi:Mg/Co/Ni transporter MgtE